MTLPAAPISVPRPPKGHRPMLGIAFMALGFACFSVSDATAKFLTREMPAMEVVWFRQLGLLVVAAILLARVGPSILRTRRPALQVSRGVVAALSSTGFVLAITYVPLADAVAISFAAPFLVTILGALVLREAVGIRRWSAIAVGVIGMMIVVRPGLGSFHPAMLLVIASAGLFATRQILSRLIGTQDSTLTTIAYTSICSTAVLTVPLLIVWQTPTGTQQVLLLIILAASAGIGEVFVIRALEIANAVVLAPMQYTLIVWSTLWGWLVFSEFPDRWTLLGAAVIMASGAYTVHRERLAARRAAQG